jgi:4-hydroxybenzoyl-CoA reductase subunit beta
MESMPVFELQRPTSVAQAAALLATPGARLLAGGTDLVPKLRRGIERPTLLIELEAVAGLDVIAFDGDALAIGAGVTLARLAAEARIAIDYAAIVEAAREAAAPQHRNAATVGGNLCLDTRCVFYNQSEWWRAANGWCLKRGGDTCHVAPQGKRCHAAFSGDLAPALIALDAEVELVSVRGARRLPLAALYRDDGAAHLALEAGEMLTRVLVSRVAGVTSGYRKARVRGSIDFPLAGVAIALAMDNGRIARLRVALTGTNVRPLALTGTEALVGREIDDETLASLGKRVQKQASPMRTTATASNYRRQVASVLAQRLLRELSS